MAILISHAYILSASTTRKQSEFSKALKKKDTFQTE